MKSGMPSPLRLKSTKCLANFSKSPSAKGFPRNFCITLKCLCKKRMGPLMHITIASSSRLERSGLSMFMQAMKNSVDIRNCSMA